MATEDQFIIRRCQVGDEAALSLLGKATFLETYAGGAEGSDLLAHVEREHSVDRYRSWLADDLAHIWVAETAIGHSAIGYLVALFPPGAASSIEMQISRVYL